MKRLHSYLLKTCLLFMSLLSISTNALAQSAAETIYDEARIPAYQLPDPLRFNDATPVKSVADWTRRRTELLRLFAENVYGKTPDQKLPKPRVEVTSVEKLALGGKATRKEVTVWLSPQHPMRVLMYLPNSAGSKPAPVFLGLNFYGNQATNADPGITMATSWVPEQAANSMSSHRAAEASRGLDAHQWDVNAMLSRGYGLVTVYCGDLDPDFHDGYKNGIQPLFYKSGQTKPDSSEWGTVGAWAYGLSRAMDYLETDPAVDARQVALFGHSRMGKAALWAGAQDLRFAIVISNESGEGGAALARRRIGERIVHLNSRFPHWFCDKFKTFNEREDALPVDQHELLALIAPRPLYVASAEDDKWSDPKGEFMGAQAASPVYALFGLKGLTTTAFPAVNQPVGGGHIAYHIRTGKHDVTPYDWARYLDFADTHFKKK
ncbi:MAG: acetylxylan esterase [Cytophagaceae bacterium]|nr:acetylxylan esterase [Cytophagaceae bacterium]